MTTYAQFLCQNTAYNKFKHLYVSNPQQIEKSDHDIPKVSPVNMRRVQEIVGTLLYYGIALDKTMLVVVGNLIPS